MRHAKQNALHFLREAGLLDTAEAFRLKWMLIKTNGDNATFCREHPDFKAPPVAAMHDAYGHTSFRSYWNSGKATAAFIADLIGRYHPSAKRVMEWGCGSARSLRHMPKLLPENAECFGADYNDEAISWCQRNIESIAFVRNELSPPLPFDREFFDVVYAVSVLTHLSVSQQDAWIKELRRVVKPDGLLILTTHGEESAKVLLPHEYQRFKHEGVVVRSGVQEGKRCFLAYHHPEYAKDHLFSGLHVLEYIPGSAAVAVGLWGATNVEQDTWVLQN
jgi:SAM-dependent methyltransferase